MKEDYGLQNYTNITHFGRTNDGQDVLQYSIKNKHGLELRAINYGGLITNLSVPDHNGEISDIVLGYNVFQKYIEQSPYFGAIVGRYGNRIARGKFKLDGKEYTLALNNNPGGKSCHLHGGIKGFDKVIWDVTPVVQKDAEGLKFTYTSKDGEEGYPGNVEITVFYYLTYDNILRLEYYAETDKATPINLTQHSYFNLKGEGNGDILDHKLYINGDYYTPVDEGLIPTGDIEAVKGTPFDFRTIKSIGEGIHADNKQLKFGGGYDHNYVLNCDGEKLEQVALIFEPESRRQLEVWSTEPGVQFYSGNNIEGSCVGKSGKPYIRHGGFCLETQHYPDSPNQDNFPSTILRPGHIYKSITEFRFSVRD